MYKSFSNYSEAYSLYSDIVSGRDLDRKNPTITWTPNERGGTFMVWWEQKGT